MKTAEQWVHDWPGDTNGFASVEANDIRAIQADAIEHCLTTLTATLPQSELAFEKLHTERVALLKAIGNSEPQKFYRAKP